MVDRGFIGTTPAATERDDESYLDFVEGVRVFNTSKIAPVMAERGARALAEYSHQTGRPLTDMGEVRLALANVPVVNTRNRVWRWSQEMLWEGVIDTYRKREPALLRELAEADTSGPGTVEYDPNFQYPDYFAKVDFHIQPGGYYADPLAGYVYHYGTKVFFTGRNNNDDVQRGLVNMLPRPKTGDVHRVLDLACSVGQGATAFKERFPHAEVWGIDAGAPMVRYAHKRAADMGLSVHFGQRLAEDTKFGSGSFDIVYAFILFHEIPLHIQRQVVAEAHRLLRPGGYFAVADFANRPAGSAAPMQEYTGFIDANYNGEPYAPEFVHSDFTALLSEYFAEVHPNFVPSSWLPVRVAYK